MIDDKTDISENWFVRMIPERYVIKFNTRCSSNFCNVIRYFWRFYFNISIQNLHDSIQTSDRGLIRIVYGRQLNYRAEETVDVDQESEQISDAQLSSQDLRCAVPQNHGEAESFD